MVSPAKIEGQREMIVTNNLKDSAEYAVKSECATISEASFGLDPAEAKKIDVVPKCNGYLQVREETDTAVNRFNIPLSAGKTAKKSMLPPIIILVLASSALCLVVWKVTRKGGREA